LDGLNFVVQLLCEAQQGIGMATIWSSWSWMAVMVVMVVILGIWTATIWSSSTRTTESQMALADLLRMPLPSLAVVEMSTAASHYPMRRAARRHPSLRERDAVQSGYLCAG
jgi:hypothetical protein